MHNHTSPRPPRSTEERSEATEDLDLMPAADALTLLANEFRRAFDAFDRSAVLLAPIVEAIVRSLRDGGRVHLVGAGSSGRLAALDAAELPPTFGVPAALFQAHLAGGEGAMTSAVEDAEDDADAGAAVGRSVSSTDVVIGVTASGRTPFVLAALEAARRVGAYTALIDCHHDANVDVDTHVTFETGAEAIAGSTRLNAATAQKLALNAISTLAMVQLGRTYSNLMVCVQPNNSKLRVRLSEMLQQISGAPPADVDAALQEARQQGGVALGILLQGWDVDVARAAVDQWVPLRELLGGAANSRVPDPGMSGTL